MFQESPLPSFSPAPPGGPIAFTVIPPRSSRSSRAARLVSALRLVDAPEPLAGRIRARQLQAVMRLTPLATAANVVNVLCVWVVFRHHPLFVALLGWGATVMLAMGRALHGWYRAQGRPPRDTLPRRATHRAVVGATGQGVLWGLLPVLLFPGSESAHQVLVGTLTAGMMCAGAFMMGTVPAAATGFAGAIAVGGGVALLSSRFPLAWALGVLLAMYTVIVVGSVWSSARVFVARLKAESEAAGQSEVIGLLLRDFEENASDQLWEMDARGHLRHVSPRLASLFGLDAALLSAMPVLDLLGRLQPADDEVAAQQLAQLAERLTRREPFRDQGLTVHRNGHSRWWSLTAKPLTDERGQPAGWRGVATDVTEARQATQQLTFLAHYDPLTQLINRQRLRAELATMLAPAACGGTPAPFALLCLDLDGFKAVNDTLGHGVGDGLLKAVAERLRAHTRRGDLVARLGGDEFAVVLRGVGGASEAATLTQRLLDGLFRPCEVEGTQVPVRSSIGVALAPRDGVDIDTLLRHADLALYAAKAAGRGEFRFFVPAMAQARMRRRALEQALRQALPRGELSLYFQPQVDLQRCQVTGFEALLRWTHPELGSVPPTEFIPVAEEAGLIQDIGEWVLAEACRHAATWPAGLVVSVNVSPVQALGGRLVEHALAAAHAADLAPQRLELELTESVFLQESEATAQVLAQLRAAGLRIALDDFGTGYSSLAYLRRQSFDTLKIDRSFVREIMARTDARAIVRTIIGLAQTLRMRTVAEGVEQAPYAAVLARYGCDAMQGYLVSPAMPAGQVAGFLADWAARPRLPLGEAPPTAPMPLAESNLA